MCLWIDSGSILCYCRPWIFIQGVLYMAATISRGIRAPIIRQGDDIVKIVADSVLETAEKEHFELHTRT